MVTAFNVPIATRKWVRVMTRSCASGSSVKVRVKDHVAWDEFQEKEIFKTLGDHKSLRALVALKNGWHKFLFYTSAFYDALILRLDINIAIYWKFKTAATRLILNINKGRIVKQSELRFSWKLRLIKIKEKSSWHLFSLQKLDQLAYIFSIIWKL